MPEKYQEIGNEFYAIKSSEESFHRNIYLKRFIGKKQNINMLMDPGTKLDITNLLDVLKELIGGIQNIDIVFLSHQDPDVTSNCNTVLTAAPRASVIASIDTWRLISMYGISEKRFISTEKLGFGTLNLKRTGHRIQFVPARFCHFRGAMMFYDHESNILFSGDFLGGVNSRKGEGMDATEESWGGISTFHQLYMPSQEALKETVDKIGMLDPLPAVIAPQHGDIIRGKLMTDFLGRISKLQVGIDLEKSLEPEENLVVTALNQFCDTFEGTYPKFYKDFVAEAQKGGEFTSPFQVSQGRIVGIAIKSDEAFNYAWETVKKVVPDDSLGDIKTHFIISLDSLNLPIPEQLKEQGVGVSELF